MIPQLPSRNRTPRRRENTDGSTSSTFLASESSFNRSKSQAVEQLLDRRESITYKHEWRIEDVSQLAAHVEGQASGSGTSEGSSRDHEGHEAQESPSEILRAGRKSADEMYKFDLGTLPFFQRLRELADIQGSRRMKVRMPLVFYRSTSARYYAQEKLITLHPS